MHLLDLIERRMGSAALPDFIRGHPRARVLLAVSLVISTVLRAFSSWLGGGENIFWQAINFALGVLAALFAMLFKWFPDADVRWEDALKGGVATSLLFNIGKLGISWYIGSQGLESTYGAAASILVLLIWVYYSAQIVLFGAEVTHILEVDRRNFTISAEPSVT
jgi:membrane protein